MPRVPRGFGNVLKLFVINQSQSPTFQDMVASLAMEFGGGGLFTGTPYRNDCAQLSVQKGVAYRRGSYLQRLISWILFTLEAGMRSVFLPRDAFVLAVTNPPFLPYIAWMLNKLRGIRYGLLLWDLYPEHLVREGFIREGGFIERGWRRLNKVAFRDAAFVMVPGNSMRKVVEEGLAKAGLRRDVTTVPNWADTESLYPIEKAQNPFAIQHDQVGKVSVVYSGNMGRTHGMATILGAAERMKEEEDIAFLLIGDGLERREVEEICKARRLTNVKLLPRQPWENLRESLGTGDIAIVMQASGTEALSVPSKTYSMMAVGCAIAACTSATSDLGQLVTETGIGFRCDSGDAEGLAKGLLELARDRNLLVQRRERARRVAVERFSHGVSFERFKEVFASAVRE